ncbi:RNA 2',3'-cyclic phosphodiesterase [Aureliella helgolandensis]|uniref:RNA 2',3'-cyclic phosphodiesterase n=1 Tax=Aureliella helgolandensis TaxID=2527968 RepID=A0A518GG03_9BACT|nr:RNA 2',3'-cyclic phosphodiesterase [Aureliella helgolandensis]QDV27531.1 2',5' RNA ligase family [Aureliella helgolandensis]
MQTTRCFVAVQIGPPAISMLSKLLGKLGSSCGGVRWTRAEQLHLTLKFCGEVDNILLPKICEAMRAAVSGVEPFRVDLSGLGAFPKGKPPRVVWVGMDSGVEPLRWIHGELDRSLEEIGIPREVRPFAPHITLGRVARGADLSKLEQAIESLQAEAVSDFEVDEVVLMAATKERGKPVYDIIDSVDL